MNRLRHASSPYLLQHADNPVHWREWGEKAFAEARRLDRPVLLSIGYAACHWCHVMAHESFEDEAVADVMNALFVSIKVDREERPDIDHLYMSALHALGEQGGWPLTMFLAPDARPFWGGTYFPKTARYGKPAFVDLLRRVADIYRAEPDRIRHNKDALTRLLAVRAGPGPTAEPTPEEFQAVARHAASLFDPARGGLRGAPKFPNPPILNLLWRASAADAALRQPALTTLRAMALGGVHDHVGGGFARYSVDEDWLVPHFEKMLYDNAQLLELYALAARQTGDRLLAAAAEGIVAWLRREMMAGDSFAASLDADSEGEEGRFYLWSRSEIDSILGAGDAAFYASAYGVTAQGNFEGRNIPNLRHRLASESEAARLAALNEKLLAARESRIRPGRDDKILADWNGLMIAALARAGALLDRPAWVGLARNAYRFIRESMTRERRLAHSWRGAIGVWPAFALDHAAMALAALALAENADDAALLKEARGDLDILAARYSVPESGALALNAADGETLIVRPAPTHDDAVPNANGLYAEALIRCGVMSMDDAMLERADALFRALGGAMRGQGLAHASLWSALDLRLHAAQIVIAGADAGGLRQAALALPWPDRIAATIGDRDDLPAGHPARAMAGAAATGAKAFVCVGERCSLPVAEPGAIAPMVRRMRASPT